MSDRAVGTVSRADITKDDERGGSVAPTLSEVRAVRLFAHRVELEVAHHPFDGHVVAAARVTDLQPGRFSFRSPSPLVLDSTC